MDELDKLRSLEREIEREWWWLDGALHAIAHVSSGDPGAYWQMLTQKRAVVDPNLCFGKGSIGS